MANRRMTLALIVGLLAGALRDRAYCRSATALGRRDTARPARDEPRRSGGRSALDHLSKVQDAAGWWPQAVNPAGPNNGVNGFCLLAFLGRGHTPGRGPYQAVVGRAVNYLLSTQNEQGLYASVGASQGPMYEHALATLALIEAYGSVPSLDMRRSVQRAIDLIVASQNPQGGWRYQPVPADADLSVTVMQVVALRAAVNARLNVPQATLDRAVQYVKSCTAAGGGFSYMPGHGPSFAQTAAGALCLQLLGQFDDPSVAAALKLLQSKEYNGSIDPYFYYTSYYAMQAHFQAGETQWATWHPACGSFCWKSKTRTAVGPATAKKNSTVPAVAIRQRWARCASKFICTTCRLINAEVADHAVARGTCFVAQRLFAGRVHAGRSDLGMCCWPRELVD